MILSLDLGTKLGYYKEGDMKAYTINLGKGDERFSNFIMFLFSEFNKDYPPTKIIYEGAAHQQGMAMPLYHGLVGVLKAFSIQKGIQPEAVHAMTMKKVFTGKGKWKPEECMKIAEERDFKSKYKGGKAVFSKKSPIMAKCEDLKIEFDDDNASDAFGVYYTYKELHNND